MSIQRVRYHYNPKLHHFVFPEAELPFKNADGMVLYLLKTEVLSDLSTLNWLASKNDDLRIIANGSEIELLGAHSRTIPAERRVTCA